MLVLQHRIAGVESEPASAALEIPPESGALLITDGDLRGVADDQVARLDCSGVVVVRGDVGADIAGCVQRVQQLAAREVEVMISRWAAADQVGNERSRHAAKRERTE